MNAEKCSWVINTHRQHLGWDSRRVRSFSDVKIMHSQALEERISMRG